jgi:predicted aspartyl protease
VKLRIWLGVAVLVVLFSSQVVRGNSVQARASDRPHPYDPDSISVDSRRGPAAAPVAELPFRLSSGYLIEVEGRIGTQNNLRFMLDTGATISIVDRKIADKLKLDRHPAESFNFDRNLKWESATVPEVQFGPIRAGNVVTLVGHLSEYSQFAKNADAIIGMDLLKLSNVTIDFDARKIIFHPTAQKVYSVPGDPLANCLIVELQVQGRPVRLIVDTGLPGLVLYEERLRKHVPGLRTAGQVTDVTMGGRVQAKQATIPDILFGGTNRDFSVLLVPSPTPEMLPGIDGIVGIAALHARRVHFDFEGKALSWE